MSTLLNPLFQSGPIQTPYAGMGVLYPFAIFPTAKEYKAATGKDAPPLDPKRPIKRWQDPSASPGTFNSYIAIILGTVGPDGDYAVTYHAFYDDGGPVNVPADDAEVQKYSNLPIVPYPARQLASGEVIRDISLFVRAAVVNVALFADQQHQADLASGKVLPEDRALWHAMAKALNVQGA